MGVLQNDREPKANHSNDIFAYSRKQTHAICASFFLLSFFRVLSLFLYIIYGFAYIRVHSRAVCKAPASSSFQCSATSFANGSSGFGLDIRI